MRSGTLRVRPLLLIVVSFLLVAVLYWILSDRPAAPVDLQAPKSGPPQVEVVASNLDVPWALAFAPDGRLFFTEHICRLMVIMKSGGDFQLQPEPVLRIPTCSSEEDGIRGLALDPDFHNNGYLYLVYTQEDELGARTRLSRFTERDGRAAEEKVLADGVPYSNRKYGGRLKFGPDGKLYLTTGDVKELNLSQDPDSLAGKILRFNRDGSIPKDNPYPNSPVYSLGHRNPQGMAWHPVTNQLFSTDHGPTGEFGACCHDEINLVLPGGNYGWPVVFGASEDPRFIAPVIESGESVWAPAGAEFYRGKLLPEWHGDLFFTGLRGSNLYRLSLSPPEYTKVKSLEPVLKESYGRLREVIQGPEGALYFTTSNRDGRSGAIAGPEDDKILRLVPSNAPD